jgi:small subunit ribosomal protein S6
MKTNHYESVVILNATLEDAQIESIISSLTEQMSANGVEITDIDKWGRKRLAYPIKKGKSGFYIIFHFTSPREYITKFERTLRLDENVIRFLTIKLEQKDLDFIAKRKIEKSEEAEEAKKPAAEVVVETTKEVVVETAEEVKAEAADAVETTEEVVEKTSDVVVEDDDKDSKE